MLRHRVKSRCRKVQGMFSEYIDSSLSHEERGIVEHHLEECEVCSSELESLRMTVQMLHRVPVVQTPRSFAIAEVEERRASIFAPQNLRWLRPATASAVIALMLLLSVDFLVVGGGELVTQPPAQTMSAPTPGQEIDMGEARGDILPEATPGPVLEAGEEAPTEELLEEEPALPGAPESEEVISGEGKVGWALIRQIEVAIGVLLLALVVTTVFARRQRRKWRGA